MGHYTGLEVPDSHFFSKIRIPSKKKAQADFFAIDKEVPALYYACGVKFRSLNVIAECRIA